MSGRAPDPAGPRQGVFHPREDAVSRPARKRRQPDKADAGSRLLHEAEAKMGRRRARRTSPALGVPDEIRHIGAMPALDDADAAIGDGDRRSKPVSVGLSSMAGNLSEQK
jgi:hypothetical protein